MEKKVKEFVEEINDKFSELYVQTFLIRFISDYKEYDIVSAYEFAYKKLIIEIKKQIIDALENIGIDTKNINL